MADIELVIKIPEEMYDWYDNGFPAEDDAEKLWQIVKNGIQLPKGHSDLIDREELKNIIKENDPLSMTGFSVSLCDIYRATPIIEADTESEGSNADRD